MVTARRRTPKLAGRMLRQGPQSGLMTVAKKTIFILRHAKAGRDDIAVSDHARSLTKRGREAASLMATHMGRSGIAPDFVLCSDAMRTRETLERIQPGLGRPARTEIRADLYLADAHFLFNTLRDLDDGAQSALIVGHNPGLEDLALMMSGSAERNSAPAQALARLREKFPTCALAIVDYGVKSWADLRPGKGQLRAFVLPEDLGANEQR